MVFAVAKAHRDLPLAEVEILLDHVAYEPRMAAFCILDFQAQRQLTEHQRRELYETYLRCQDRITAWDMVDRAAPRVVGGYLAGRDLEPLRRLAQADHSLRRRTALRLATEKLRPDERAHFRALSAPNEVPS